MKFAHQFCRIPKLGTQLELNRPLRGTITEEQGEIPVAPGKVIGGESSINGPAVAMQRSS